MCTVTFIARRRGYLLGMNRDEKITRVAALPPARRCIGDREAMFPSEPGGGTWIGVNEAGVTFALINWYSVKARVAGAATSRGEIVKRMLPLIDPAAAMESLRSAPLERINPFRLIGVFPRDRIIIEWRWNLSRLQTRKHPWETNTWISSGHDEAGARQIRGRAFREALRQTSAGSPGWLRRLHRSHGKERGPYSHCMHRDDARTVSYTEIAVTGSQAALRYAPCSPCACSPSLAGPTLLQI